MDPNVPDGDGRCAAVDVDVWDGTLLHWAARRADLALLTRLVEHGADPRRNTEGKRYYDLLSVEDRLSFLAAAEYPMDVLERQSGALWFAMVSQVRPVATASATIQALYGQLCDRVLQYVSRRQGLSELRDDEGRTALEAASKPMKEVMEGVLNWHGRYRVNDLRPEHASATCLVFKGLDLHPPAGQPVPMPVALKLMRSKLQFRRELDARTQGFSPDFVVDVVRSHPDADALAGAPDEVEIVRTAAQAQALSKAQAERYFLLAMPLAERNLFVALKSESWAGHDLDEVRHVFVQLVHGVEHVHSRGWLHADIKVRVIGWIARQRWRVDLHPICLTFICLCVLYCSR